VPTSIEKLLKILILFGIFSDGIVVQYEGMRNTEQDWRVDGVLMGAQLLLAHDAISFSVGFRDLDIEETDIVETGPDGQAFDWELF
jgi:hypothetical protein